MFILHTQPMDQHTSMLGTSKRTPGQEERGVTHSSATHRSSTWLATPRTWLCLTTNSTAR